MPAPVDPKAPDKPADPEAIPPDFYVGTVFGALLVLAVMFARRVATWLRGWLDKLPRG